MKLYMFRTVRLSITRSLFTVHSAMVYVIQVCRQLSSRTRTGLVPSWSCSTDELSETCRVSWQNKFVKLVHLVGFITNKFVTMHGHMNVKKKRKKKTVTFASYVKGHLKTRLSRTRTKRLFFITSLIFVPLISISHIKFCSPVTFLVAWWGQCHYYSSLVRYVAVDMDYVF